MFHAVWRVQSRAGFSENPPSLPSRDIFTGIFQLIKLRNLGTKYWVYGVARKLGFGENSVWSSIPLGLERGYQTCWRGELRAQSEPRDAKRPRIDGEAWDWAQGAGEGARWAPPQKNFENSYLKPCILEHSWSENLNFSPSGSRNFLEIFQRFWYISKY